MPVVALLREHVGVDRVRHYATRGYRKSVCLTARAPDGLEYTLDEVVTPCPPGHFREMYLSAVMALRQDRCLLARFNRIDLLKALLQCPS